MFFQLGTGTPLQQTMERAGFSAIEVARLPTLLHHESADDACGAAFAGEPVALAYSKFDEATRADVHAEYLSSIEPWRSGDRYDVPAGLVVARGLS